MRRLHRSRGLAAIAGCAIGAGLLSGPLGGGAAAASAVLPTVTPTALHFLVHVGPTGTLACDVVADLYSPAGVSRSHPAPAILTTNGFGGSKADQAGIAQQYVRNGYVVLSYSGLGFGGSGCPIELDDRDYDGKAGSQLIDFLGGKSGNAFLDAAHTQPVAAPDYVVRDDRAGRKAADGKIHPNDPRVGMIGGSYGGEIQFAVAGIDPRLDTIIPQITWNDLGYSLAPNNTGTAGVTSTAANPGTEKFDWVSLFFGLGIVDGVQGATVDPTRMTTGCPNFDARACPAKAQMDALGYPDADTYAFAHHASVASYLSAIRIPTLLSQGQADTLFNLREAATTYTALKKQGTFVKMIWQEWGHSGGAAVNENLTGPQDNPQASYDGARYLNWFNHFLKLQSSTPTGPDLAYFQDWVKDSGVYGIADPRYGSATAPVAGGTYYLSGTADLVAGPTAVQPGSSTFAVTGGPSSYTETSALDQTQPVTDTPGTFAAFATAPLGQAVTLVGFPKLTVRLSAPGYQVSQNTGPGGQLVVFAKLYDVAPNGTITLVHRLIAPVRVADVSQPVQITLPGIVHRVPAGDKLEVVLAGGDAAYKEGLPGAVSVVNDPTTPNVLTLPLVATH